MKGQPLVSIIIPTYNRAHLIGETLESVLAQTYQNWECIVVDDGSTDATNELLEFYCKKDSRFSYNHRPKDRPKGANACRNYGFEMSKGEYILFLDSDDLLENFCIEERIKCFFDKKIDFVVADTGTLNEHKKSYSSIGNSTSNSNFLLSFLSYRFPWWSVMSVLWKREVLNKFRFDETLMRFQDVDFHIRILMKDEFSFYKLPVLDNFYRIRKNTEQENFDAHRKNVIYSLINLLNEFNEDFNLDKRKHNAFKRFFYVICRDFVFLKKNNSQEYFTIIYKEANKNYFFNSYDKIIYGIYYLYTFLDFKNVKGIGVHRLRKFSNEYYDNLNNTIQK